MKRLFAVALVSLALFAAGCSSGEKKDGGGGTATAAACSKCKCTGWTDGNGDGKCDTLVDGKPCDHLKADHPGAK